ncbi:hypothetical protein QW131_23175 [Roseibium salinum]|nr:hypothetical protein [Roseibium salinum]
MNEAIKGELLTDKAYQALVSALRTGTLRNGQFVSMSQLVDLLEYPIAPVREAVKQGSAQGVPVDLAETRRAGTGGEP